MERLGSGATEGSILGRSGTPRIRPIGHVAGRHPQHDRAPAAAGRARAAQWLDSRTGPRVVAGARRMSWRSSGRSTRPTPRRRQPPARGRLGDDPIVQLSLDRAEIRLRAAKALLPRRDRRHIRPGARRRQTPPERERLDGRQRARNEACRPVSARVGSYRLISFDLPTGYALTQVDTRRHAPDAGFRGTRGTFAEWRRSARRPGALVRRARDPGAAPRRCCAALVDGGDVPSSLACGRGLAVVDRGA